ncbi:MAG: VOC family protein [Chloroflexota bacterium]
MDYETYRKNFFTDPLPEQRFAFAGLFGATLYYQDYPAALAFYTEVLGPPAYIEGEHTHSWTVGSTWLTLFPSKGGDPTNLEVGFYVETPEEVDRLTNAFITAGAKGEPPIDTMMHVPVRMSVLTDPFGVNIAVIARL